MEAGDSIQVSESCNPNFIHYFFLEPDIKYNCDEIMNMGLCGTTVLNLIHYSQWNTDGHLETFLQCPQCGCGSEGAANLNDLYAAELDGSRKVSDVANTMFQNLIETIINPNNNT